MAELTPAADGPMDLELLAAALRADTSDMEMFFEVMAKKLTDILGPRAEVERRGSVLRREKPVARIRVVLGDDQMELARVRGSIECLLAHRVRGVVLRTEQVELSQWLDSLVRHLEEESRRNASTRAALEALLT
jgi:hypothetical protein